jgi:large subunit ribosomal protein L32
LTNIVNFATICAFFYLFMPLPSFRNSRSKVRRRRAHHALKATAGTSCTNCGATILPHRACKACGFYKGRNLRGASVAKAEKVVAKAIKKSVEVTEAKKPVAKRASRKATKKTEVAE